MWPPWHRPLLVSIMCRRQLSCLPSAWVTVTPTTRRTWASICIPNYAAHIDGALELTKPHIQPLQHTGKSFLMDKACNSGLFKPAKLKYLNYCRLYLKVLTPLSDVTNAKGNLFAPGILDSTRSVQQSSFKGPSAKQERPDDVTWALWRQLPHIFGSKNQLFLPLGPWISSGSELCRDWPTLFFSE
jgi:hypothetical protein